MSYVFFPQAAGKENGSLVNIHWFNSLGFQVVMVVTPKVSEKMHGPQKETIQSSNPTTDFQGPIITYRIHEIMVYLPTIYRGKSR